MISRLLRNPAYSMLAFGILCVAIAVFTSFPQPSTLTTQSDQTTILFSADRDRVLFPSDCVLLTWDVQNTQRVIVNDILLSAQGTQPYCVTAGDAPQIQILLPDGQEVTYTLDIQIVSAQPLWVLGLGTGLLFVILGLGTLIKPYLPSLGWGKGMRLIFINIFVTVAAVGVLVLIAELGVRLYFTQSGTRAQKIMYVYSVEEVRSLQSSVLHMPYVSYVPEPNYEAINNLGYRGADITVPKPEGVFRIVAVGGSTTFSTGTSAEESYPALLQQILRDQYGLTRVEVINGGVSGYTTWEILAAFQFRVLELEPNMVIFYEAVNDLVVRERASVDCYRGLNPLRGINAIRGQFVERNAPYPPSMLYRILAVNLGWMPNPLALESSFEPINVDCAADAGDMTIEKRLQLNSPTYYERNIYNLMALALANDVQPVLSSWAYNVDGNRPDLWRSEIARHNEITRQIAADLTIPYIDLAATYPPGNDYWEADAIHMIALGTREQASQYAAFLVENDLLPMPD